MPKISYSEIFDLSSLPETRREDLAWGKNYGGPYDKNQSYFPSEKELLKYELKKIEDTPEGQELFRQLKEKNKGKKVKIHSSEGFNNCAYIGDTNSIVIDLSIFKTSPLDLKTVLKHEIAHSIDENYLKKQNEYVKQEKKDIIKTLEKYNPDVKKYFIGAETELKEYEKLIPLYIDKLTKNVKNINLEDFFEKLDEADIKISDADKKEFVRLQSKGLSLLFEEKFTKIINSNKSGVTEDLLKQIYDDELIYYKLEINKKITNFKENITIAKDSCHGIFSNLNYNDENIITNSINKYRFLTFGDTIDGHENSVISESFAMIHEHLDLKRNGKSKIRDFYLDTKNWTIPDKGYVHTSENTDLIMQNIILPEKSKSDRDIDLVQLQKETFEKNLDLLSNKIKEIDKILKDQNISKDDYKELLEIEKTLKAAGIKMHIDTKGGHKEIRIPDFYLAEDFSIDNGARRK